MINKRSKKDKCLVREALESVPDGMWQYDKANSCIFLPKKPESGIIKNHPVNAFVLSGWVFARVYLSGGGEFYSFKLNRTFRRVKAAFFRQRFELFLEKSQIKGEGQ